MKREEWDFTDVPEPELDACFCYEYARSADAIKNGMRAWRKSFPELPRVKIDWFNAPTDSWLPGTIRHSDQAEFEKYAAAMLDDDAANGAKPKSLSHIDDCLVDFVARFKEFPKKSWKLIKDSPLKRKSADEWRVPTAKDTSAKPGLCLSELTRKLFVWQEMELPALEMIQEAERHPSNISLKHSHHLFALSWNYRNQELASAFETWLEKNRPHHFPEPKHAKSVTGWGWQRFPFRKKNALEWLGVLRRRDKVKTWREYFRLYKGCSFSRGAERAHEEDCRKAKLILNWFSHGKPLRKQDFK